MMAQAKGRFSLEFTDAYQQKAYNQEIPLLPEGPMGAGSVWSQESKLAFLPPLPEMISKVENTFESVLEDVATIRYTGTLEKGAEADVGEADPNDPLAAMSKMIQIMEGKHEGTLEFDHERGLVRKAVQKIGFSMDMRGQKIPMKQVRTLELVERPEPAPEEAAKEEVKPAEPVEIEK